MLDNQTSATWGFLQKLSLLSIIAVLAFGAWFYIGGLVQWLLMFNGPSNQDPWTMSSCDRSEKVVAQSPDGLLRAITLDFACGGFGAIGTWTVVVIVDQGQQPSEKAEVLYVSGVYDENTELEWKGFKHLHIVVPRKGVIHDQKAIHRSVYVTVGHHK